MTRRTRGRDSARQNRTASAPLWTDDFVIQLYPYAQQPLLIQCLHLEQIRQRLRIAEQSNDDHLYEALLTAMTACRLRILITETMSVDDWRCKAESLLVLRVPGENDSFLTAAEAVLIEDGLRLGVTDCAVFLRHHLRHR